MQNRIKSLVLALVLPVATIASVGASEVSSVTALGGCTRVDGAQYTSGQCTTPGTQAFMHAEQTCVLNYYTYVVQRGPSVGQGGYSSAGPCTAPIVNRKLVQTSFP